MIYVPESLVLKEGNQEASMEDHNDNSDESYNHRKVVRPSYYDDYYDSDGDSEKEEAENLDDGIGDMSFGALNAAQKKIREEDKYRKMNEIAEEGRKSTRKGERDTSGSSEGEDLVEEEDGFFEKRAKKKSSKHGPAESSSKKPVSKIREIPGLHRSTLYRDIRFDPAYGKPDPKQARKNYGFLDEYRKKEIEEIEFLLRTEKHLGEDEREALKLKAQSLKSRMETMQKKDLEQKVMADYKKQQIDNVKKGKQAKPHFLKRSEKRNLIQKAKFEKMSARQREKVMERKRKKRFGKEMRQLESGI